jgi:hypothetical protein
MRPIVLAITLFVLSLATQQPRMALAQNDQASPDFDLAYVLATASYCAYAVGEADDDHGQKRAVQCLKIAADRDREQLDVFRDIKQDNVETFFNPSAPENAYLLIQTRTGVILAFRGTLTPPISPSARFPAAVAQALAKYKEREATLLATFITDWKNNLVAIPDTRDRHSGFDAAWSGLQAHLIAKECVPTTGGAPVDCSKFPSFVSRLHDTASPQLYVTGHSKGGALATLAALDLPSLVGSDIVPVVYTFAGAKVLTADGAERYADAVKGMWRFEHEDDIVPYVPLDSTVIPWPAYAHVGSRAFFAKGHPPQLSPGPVHGVEGPGDRDRLTATALKLLSSASQSFNAANFIASIQSLGAINCKSLVDNHFLIFADLQELVHARHAGAPTTITEENLNRSFFYTGLSDGEGEILWGYSQWCSLLSAASAK